MPAKLTLVACGPNWSAAEQWDIDTQLWLASTLEERLHSDPPPAGSVLGRDLRAWAENLARHVQDRQEGRA